jgi:formylglycine-generating enzyme required for sulfatase activity
MGKACIILAVGALVLSVASCQDYVCLFPDEPTQEDGGVFVDREDQSLCEGIDCSGHGLCEVFNGVPGCTCNAGYRREGLDCVENCWPNCQGKECGPDECGSTCPPGCGALEACNDSTGQCECVPDCSRKSCGPDGCGGTCQPGCGAGEVCNESTGQCEGCAPDCSDRVCGSDNCGGTCPPGCGAEEKCNQATGQCEVCAPDCAGRECGTDGCSGTCPPGCVSGERCNGSIGQCECAPDCEGKNCGPDSCGGTCSPGCRGGAWCNNGLCEAFSTELIWVRIPGGSFMMGSEAGNDDERPVHRVDVPTFEMTMTEVTVAQYQTCVDAEVCKEPYEYPSNWKCNWGKPERGNHPVNCITWEQAGVFCRWSGGRLPTEAQWEYAARGGGQDIEYPWGNQPATCYHAVIDEDAAGGEGCGIGRVWAVCSKTAGNTAHGLCDMSGNVYEWVRDHYHDNYVGAPTDGSSWEHQWFGDRVCRGNCFMSSNPRAMRASNRAFFPAYGSPHPGYAEIFGIRCARPADP